MRRGEVAIRTVHARPAVARGFTLFRMTAAFAVSFACACRPSSEAPVPTTFPARASVEPAVSMPVLITPVLVPPRSMAATPSADDPRPLNKAVVFYEVPVNVDSLSADAIVRRFAVSRAIADFIVQERTANTRP